MIKTYFTHMEQLSVNVRLTRFITNILPSVLPLKNKLDVRKNLLLVHGFFLQHIANTLPLLL